MSKNSAQVDAAPRQDDHDLGLSYDAPTLIGRRRMLMMMAGAGASAVALTPALAHDHCVPVETVLPFSEYDLSGPARHANDVLSEAGVIRSDMRGSFAGLTSVAGGVRLDFELELVSADAHCAPLGGCAIYIWHCDAAGRYSLYDIKDCNYLRAVGVVGANGKVSFTTIFPGCYAGRWPHIHFEVFKSVIDAVSGARPVLASRWAFAEQDCRAVYSADARYAASLSRLSRLRIEDDAAFRGNTDRQMRRQTMQTAGAPSLGYQGKLRIPIAASPVSVL